MDFSLSHPTSPIYLSSDFVNLRRRRPQRQEEEVPINYKSAVRRRFVWVYASIQFALVVLFAHIFYSLVRVQAVLSVILATFAGFGVAMSASSLIIELSEMEKMVCSVRAISW
ncbi:hypothetical protein CFOL_v3_26155 [Cephalotus follicularis]|uniref:Uncharacterized protein n=1 Tax=Cephalotus follicularis TaxID=3775 RepID=A0A1Q3CR33_CEPFO|nr:hypothetical protein CFOL_v3_26155 [Cephalotus follicularis]